MSKNEWVVKAGVVCLFAVLTFIHFLPLSLHPAAALNDHQDSLLNTWILSWTGNRVFSDPLRLFEAGVFHPHTNTLGYSEHLFPLALMALPVARISGNPVLAYNFVFFLGFVLNGFAAWLLVKHLTRSGTAGIAAGVVFAFCSYQMQHQAHLQLINAWFIPLALLYLHKYFERPSLKNAALFSLFVTLQALACIYYGLFLLSILAVIFPLYLLLRPPRDKARFYTRLIPPASISAVVLFLFSLPYLRLFRTFRFQRELDSGADLSNFLAAFPKNLLWGASTSSLGGEERYLFPGLLALALAALGVFVMRRHLTLTPAWLRFGLFAVSAGAAAVSTLVLATGGINISIGIADITAHNEAKPAFIAIAGAGLFLFASLLFFRFRKPRKEENVDEGHVLFLYLALLLAAFFLSFGREFTFNGLSPFESPEEARLFSPFTWLYSFVPGFKGIREPVRYAVFVMLGVSVLVGFGTKALLSATRNKTSRAVLAGCLLLFLNTEYLAVPMRTTFIPVGRDIPPTYEWLRNEPGDFALVEVPLFHTVSEEAIPMYFSIFHGKKTVNGYSGFIPPAAWYVRNEFLGFPSRSCFDILNAFDVRYLIFRPRMWGKTRAENALHRLEDQFSDYLRPVRVFRYPSREFGPAFRGLGEDHVYELIRRDFPPAEIPEDRPLDARNWTPQSNIRIGNLDLLADGDRTTAWSTHQPRRSGMNLEIELDRPRHVTRILFHLAHHNTFAVDMLIETSLDGIDWWPHEQAYAAGAFALNLVNSPLEPVQIAVPDGRAARFIRITQQGGHPHDPWSVAELEIRVAD